MREQTQHLRSVFLALMVALPWALLLYPSLGALRHNTAHTKFRCAAQLPPPSMDFNITHETVPPGCLHLEDVCVDQQMIVMMDPRYNVVSADHLPLPRYKSKFKYVPPVTSSSQDVFVSGPTVDGRAHGCGGLTSATSTALTSPAAVLCSLALFPLCCQTWHSALHMCWSPPRICAIQSLSEGPSPSYSMLTGRATSVRGQLPHARTPHAC